jgi:hypothetical protein
LLDEVVMHTYLPFRSAHISSHSCARKHAHFPG